MTDLVMIIFEIALSVMSGILTWKVLLDIFYDVGIYLYKSRHKQHFRKKASQIIVDYWKRNRMMVVLCSALFVLFIFTTKNWVHTSTFFVSIIPQILKTFIWKNSAVEVSKAIEEDRTNIGRSLAVGFLFNYLDKILPDIMNKIKAFKNNYEAKLMTTKNLETDALPIIDFIEINLPKKIYIFIPKSGHYLQYGTLCKADSGLEWVDDLEEHVENKDGIKKRQFHNSVYLLKNDKSFYFVGEYATPLTAIHEVQEKYSGKQSADQIKIFYQSLNDLLQKKILKYGGVCQLVYYDDDEINAISNVMRDILYKEKYAINSSKTSNLIRNRTRN